MEYKKSAPKGIGKKIYDATGEQCDTNKYRNEMCAAWMLQRDKFDSAKSCASIIPKSHCSTSKRQNQMIDADNHLISQKSKKFRFDEDFLNGFNESIVDGQKRECEKNREAHYNLHIKRMGPAEKLPSQSRDKYVPKERHISDHKYDASRLSSDKKSTHFADDRRHKQEADAFFMDFPESPMIDSTGMKRNSMNMSNEWNGTKHIQPRVKNKADKVWASKFLEEFQHNEHGKKEIQPKRSHGKSNDLIRVNEVRNRGNKVAAIDKSQMFEPNEMRHFIFPPVHKTNRRELSSLNRPIVNIYCKNLCVSADLLQ